MQQRVPPKELSKAIASDQHHAPIFSTPAIGSRIAAM